MLEYFSSNVYFLGQYFGTHYITTKPEPMYYPNDIEEICYDPNHIQKVLDEIGLHLPPYFQKYIETEGGNSVTDEAITNASKANDGIEITLLRCKKLGEPINNSN